MQAARQQTKRHGDAATGKLKVACTSLACAQEAAKLLVLPQALDKLFAQEELALHAVTAYPR